MTMKTQYFIEIDEQVNRKIRINLDTDYVMVFKSVFQLCKNLPHATGFFVIWLISKSGEEGLLPSLPELERAYIEETGCKSRVFYKHLKVTRLHKVLIRPREGHYRLNPLTFWKGQLAKRPTILKALTEGGHNMKLTA